MARLTPSTETIRALFARSGNRCAFPGCTAQLVNERNKFIGQVCHIKAAEQGGERFNEEQSDEERRSYSNLLLLCYPHHIETNEVSLYSPESLQLMKGEHEKLFGKKIFKIDESLLYQVAQEMDAYWKRIDELHRHHHVVSELAIEIDASATFLDAAGKANGLVAQLGEIQQYLMDSDRLEDEKKPVEMQTGPKHFEMVYIGFTNILTKLSVALAQMEIKHLEEFIKLNPSDQAARRRLDQRKEEFATYAVSAGYAD
ncbi:HNH endonuclease [bacterium]|nr:MAG: HNH endonuclease [bacterium]